MTYKKAMHMCNHARHKLNVYAEPQEAQITFVKMMDVSSYLHRLMDNETLRDEVASFTTNPEAAVPPCMRNNSTNQVRS